MAARKGWLVKDPRHPQRVLTCGGDCPAPLPPSSKEKYTKSRRPGRSHRAHHATRQPSPGRSVDVRDELGGLARRALRSRQRGPFAGRCGIRGAQGLHAFDLAEAAGLAPLLLTLLLALQPPFLDLGDLLLSVLERRLVGRLPLLSGIGPRHCRISVLLEGLVLIFPLRCKGSLQRILSLLLLDLRLLQGLPRSLGSVRGNVLGLLQVLNLFPANELELQNLHGLLTLGDVRLGLLRVRGHLPRGQFRRFQLLQGKRLFVDGLLNLLRGLLHERLGLDDLVVQGLLPRLGRGDGFLAGLDLQHGLGHDLFDAAVAEVGHDPVLEAALGLRLALGLRFYLSLLAGLGCLGCLSCGFGLRLALCLTLSLGLALGLALALGFALPLALALSLGRLHLLLCDLLDLRNLVLCSGQNHDDEGSSRRGRRRAVT
mmetsp:Transcript_7219/g.18188  ORF Transcript_7219/g.18188 Transcript_7219/m.18188 type:complete len:428 (+) Transcript_7219:120-1403(+)